MKDSTAKPGVKEIFLVAREMACDIDREEYLEEVVGDDDACRRRVESLLEAEKLAATNPLDAAVVTMKQPGWRDSGVSGNDALKSRQIGPYKLLHRLGEGGMGDVYAAEQTKPVQRVVAVKLIKRGMDSKEVLARFDAERQALALMNHPNIARIIEAGETDDGLPYFVMDLVRGIPITQYCEQHRLSVRDRLELLQTVCEAVQHAHQKGLIHRDLKPSNILVELHDVRHVPKVIDFGVAKATNQRLTEKTLYTHFSHMVGTPLYMSPEQAELSGLDVDTRSDVYALGVVLYELLTGTTPFDRSTLSKVGFDEMRRIIREEDPPRPSHRVSTLKAAAGSTIDTTRRFHSVQHREPLSGELDWIVMKALEKDRTRRYESPSALAADIQCYLRDQPVQACPPSLSYRLGKVSRRYKGLLVTAAAVLIALLVGTGIASWQAVLAGAAAEQAELERAQAEQERAQAERNMQAAMDAVERLLANVTSPELAAVPGLQEKWASILQESVEFYERFKENSGSSPDVDFRAAKVFLHYGRLLQQTQPDSRDVIATFLKGLKLADAIVIQDPKRNEYRELQAELNLDCADYYWLPQPRRTKESDAQTIKHFQSAQEQYAYLTLAEPGKRDYSVRQGFALARLAMFYKAVASDDPQIKQLMKRAQDAGFINYHMLASIAAKDDPQLARQYVRKAIDEYRSNSDRPIDSRTIWMLLSAAKGFVNDDPELAEWLWQETIKKSFSLLKDFPSNRDYRGKFDTASLAYSTHLLKVGNPAQALSKVDALIQSHPAFHVLRAKILDVWGDVDVQLELLNESIRRFPTQADYYRVRAEVLEDQGNLESALDDLNHVLELEENHEYAYKRRANVAFKLGDYRQAIDDHTRRLEMNGGIDWDKQLKRRAAAHFELGEFAEALADLNLEIDQFPEYLTALTFIPLSKVAACPDPEFRAGILLLADRAVELNRGSAESIRVRASLLAALGNTE